MCSKHVQVPVELTRGLIKEEGPKTITKGCDGVSNKAKVILLYDFLNFSKISILVA